MFRQIQRILTFRPYFLQLNRSFAKAIKGQIKLEPVTTLPIKQKQLQQQKELIMPENDNDDFALEVPEKKDYQLLAEDLLKITNKKALDKISNSDLIEVNKFICKTPNSSFNQMVWHKLEEAYQKRIESMEVSEIAEVLWLYAYANRKDPKFFKVLEDGILSKDFAENYDHKIIRKILWGFSHANFGSSLLYSSMAVHIKRTYHEINPVMLAEYSNYFSKASNSMKGGFGVYQITELVLSQRLRDMDILQIKKVCEYLLPQNIGSNDFYKQLEERILDLYQHNLVPSVLVSLCKSTSSFRFQTDLSSKLEKNVLEYVEHLSNSQLEDVLWSFTRGKKGSEELYTKFEEEFSKRMNVLKPRGVAFSFYGFANVRKGSYSLVQKYQEYIINNIDKFNMHYLTKILIALSKTNPEYYSSDLIATIFDKIKAFESAVPNHEVIRVLESMHELAVTLRTIDWDAFYEKVTGIIISNLPRATPYDLSMILFHHISTNQGTGSLIQALKEKLTDINQIPKNAFAEGFFSYVEMGDLDTAHDFVPIVEELCGYGSIKYFFDHANFIRLIWSLASLVHDDPAITRELQKFAHQNVKDSLLEINLNTLRHDVLRFYFQTWGLFKSLGAIEEGEVEKLYQKFEELNTEQKNEVIMSDPTIHTNILVKDEVLKLTKDFVQNKNLNMTIIKDMCDEFYNIINVALINEENMQKVAVLIYNKQHYLKYSDYKEKRQSTLNKKAFLKSFEWELVEIEESEWIDLDDEGKAKFIQEKLAASIFKEQLEKNQKKKLRIGRGRRRSDFPQEEDAGETNNGNQEKQEI